MTGYPPPPQVWERVQRSYGDLMGDADPAGPLVAEFGVLDLRPGRPSMIDLDLRGPAVVSGPDDLAELREAVERVTGPGTWPVGPPGNLDGPLRTAQIGLARPGTLMGLVAALEPLLVDRSQAWRTARTALDAIAAAVADIGSVTVQARIVDVT